MIHVGFEKLSKNQGVLLSFNNFLSTSADRRLALQFADGAQGRDDMTGIVFRITIDPLISSTPFASLNSSSHFGDSEEEILFSIHTVFRIGELDHLDTQLW